MRVLDRKLLRDLQRMWMQVAAIALLVACGVSVAVMAFSAQEALKAAQADYYAATRFADVFATTRRAPLSAAADLARIDGVVAVDARATRSGLMQLPGVLRPAIATLIALPDRPAAALNRVVLMQGRWPDPQRTDEVVALKTFLDAARIPLGGRLTMVIDGRQMTFTVVGAALSPEYVYVPAPASMMPDDAHNGVFWGPRAAVEKATGQGGAFSAVSLKLARGAREAAVLAAVDRRLATYGGPPAVSRADQVSHKFQQDRITRFGIIAWVIPPIFLAVAASLVHMVLGRLVESEREQIGLLKAFGYGAFGAASVYLRIAVVIGLLGAAAGGVLGGWLGGVVTGVLADYMRYPHLELRFSWGAFLAASAISAAAAGSGSLLAVARAAGLSPAVAMRPRAPATYRKGLLERLRGWGALDQPTRMILRNLERFPGRAALTLGGLGVSLSLIVGSQFMFGSFDEILDQAYFRARRWTDFVAFAELRDAGVSAELARLPGVIAAEPARYAMVRVRAHGREERAFVQGLDPQARLSRPLDGVGRQIPLKGRGLVLSGTLAMRLSVHPGDLVELEVTEGRRPRAVLPVTAVAQDYAGLSAYMDRRELGRLLGEGDLANSAELLLAPDRRADFYGAVTRAPLIAGVASRADTIASYRTTVMEILSVEMTFFAGFAAAIAFGVAFNVSRIALSERARDLATLRVLGFGRLECAYILLGELALLALVATPLGVAGGLGLANALSVAFREQDMQLPAIITAHGYGVAFSAYFATVAAACLLVGQRVWRLDLVSALKTRE
ncbi:FtsX-like permease family protein [Phenylobacterium sp.]|uniref:ABC transporter permease n=1 Tax=Phenylobacterium sp. TaxID=1871053 RepID=UPI0025F81302|nr:FtsX-like permease family protein [Phenylobacterium sp.]